MFWFILAIIFALITIGAIVALPAKGHTYKDDYGSTKTIGKSMKPLAVFPLLLALLFLFLSMFTTVGTKSVGVPTTFNKITGETLEPGPHIKAPWTKVTDIDGSVQPEEYAGDSCISVKIADGGTGCVWVAYRWRINPDNADVVFADYRNSEEDINAAVRSALVSTNMKASINEAFSDFDPLGGTKITSEMTVDELAELEVNVNPDYEAYNQEILEAFNSKIADVGGQVEVISVTVSYFQLPEGTQKRIDAFNAAVQETKIAIQDIATKKAQADANAQLENSVDNPNVLVSKCLDSLAAGDFTAPAGFNCWPGAGSGVVIPATR
jgi:regulator of protease activity HflC (stomatin/prohibitin superfamily)